MSKIRFDALAGYARRPLSLVMAEEVGWFEHGGERILATLIRDRTDGDYAGVIMGRDRNGRFRAVRMSEFEASRRRAEMGMRRAMEAVAHQPDDDYHQGDEVGEPLDFFTPVVARERLHPSFVRVCEAEGCSSARGIIEPMMHWFEDPDGNFIEQFQTTGFDARIWELYLFAAFSEMGYEIDRAAPVPDFTCRGVGAEFCVEATTVNPSREGPLAVPPRVETAEDLHAFTHEFMPIKYGSALRSKLQKRYWEKPNVQGRPLLFAIADFQCGPSVVATRTGLHVYLYGYDYGWRKDEQGRLTIIPRKVDVHRWGTKEVPSGFFDQPGAENVSAVVFNNSGTVSKFLRMGALAGFGSPRVTLHRVGTAVDHDPNAAEPRAFRHDVNSSEYRESWVEGLDVFHNPNALHPIEEWMLPGAAHHRLLPDRRMSSRTPDWHPLGSITQILMPDDGFTERGSECPRSAT